MIKQLGIWLVVTLAAACPCVATVNIVVSTYDGLVVAADSRVTLSDSKKTRIASDFGQKVKRVGSHVAVTFSGAAHLFDTDTNLRSIGSIVDEYKNSHGITDTTRTFPWSVTVGLDTLLRSRYNENQLLNYKRGLLRFTVCGYDSMGERNIYKLGYPDRREVDSGEYQNFGIFDTSLSPDGVGAVPGGQTDAWTRLVKGYNPKLSKHNWFREVEIITVDSLDSTIVDTTTETEKLNLRDLRYDIRYDLMTLQDAIDFAVFIVRATIEAQRFNQASVQGVGGAIDVAVITADGFQWVQRKKLHGEGSQ